MATLHLYLNDRQEAQLKQLTERLDIKRPAVMTMALRELFDRVFPGQSLEPAPK